MAETLTLTAPVVPPTVTTWRVVGIHIDGDAPSIKVDVASNTNRREVFRYVVDETTTAAQVQTAISFINLGKFATLQGKSLQKWLLEQMTARGFLVGTVSGTPD